MMKRTLENRIARLEKLLANHKSVKNENSQYIDLVDNVAMHLKNALDEMRKILALEKELQYSENTIEETFYQIETIQRIYEAYL